MAKEYKIAILMVADDKASKTLGQVADKTGDASDAIGDIDEKAGDATQSMSKLDKALSAAALVAGAKFAVEAGKAVHELAELGAQGLRTERSFEAIAGGADAARRKLDAMRKATQGAMSEADMMHNANMLMQMGLANTADELGNTTTMALRLGKAMGRDAQTAMEDWAAMLANQSIPRLDTFGLSSGKVKERMAELQEQTADLTREQAFLQAVQEEGTRAMERLGEATEDELLQFERLEAQMADTKMELAQKVAPAWAGFLDLLNRGTGEAIEWNRRWKQAVGGLGAGALNMLGAKDAAIDLLHNMDLLDTSIEGVGAASDLSRGQMSDYAEMAGEAVQPTKDLEQAADPAATAMDRLAEAGGKVASKFGEMEFDNEALWNLAAASGASLEELAKLAETLGIASEAEINATIGAHDLVNQFGEGVITADELVSKYGAVADSLGDAEVAGGNYGAAAVDARKKSYRLSEGASAAAREMDKLDAMAGNAADALRNIPTSIDVAMNVRGGVGGHLQHGTSYWGGGSAIVGEAGPELVNLPRGSAVYPNTSPQTQQHIRHQGDVYNQRTYNVSGALAMAMAQEQERQEQGQRANALM